MKKCLSIILCIALALTAVAALAETPATDPLHAHLEKLGQTPYTLATTEFGVLDATNYAEADIYAELLKDMTFEPAEVAVPDGEYVVLAFPEENIRFDFFLAVPQDNLFRLVNADGSEKMFKAIVPEGRADISGVMEAWIYSLADEYGLVAPIEAILPGPGWILDSVNGKTWMDDRATLEVFLEDTENYKVLISWGSSASETSEWTYGCEYHADDQTLHAVHMIHDDVVYNEQGEEDRKLIEEKDVETVFALNGEGKVTIMNAGDDQLEGKTFEAVPQEQPGAGWTIPEDNAITEALQEKFDKAIGNLMGVSYTPLAYLGEKDGTACFFCRAVVVYPDAVPYYTLVYTNDAGVQNIYEVWFDAHAE